MRVLMFAVLALTLGWAAPGLAADWSVQHFQAFGFSAAFPGAASRKTEQVQTSEGPAPTDYFYVRDDDRTYFVSSSDISNQPGSVANPDEAAKGILVGAIGTGATQSDPVRVASPNGWEASYKTDGLIVRIRTYVKAHRGYTAMILTAQDHPERVTDANAQRFFAGFSLY